MIGEKYLIPLLGAWTSAGEISFEELPNQFILKTNGSGTNVIVTDKTKKKSELNKKLKLWMDYNLAYSGGFKMNYKDLEPKIIAEKYIMDSQGQLDDYKFMCFNGNAHYCWVDFERHENHKRNAYNIEWELQPWNQYRYLNSEENVPKNDNFEEMVNLAKN